MPIFEYQCKDCNAILELLLDTQTDGPKSCGFRCQLEKGVADDLRGFGTLQRRISAFNQVEALERHSYTPDRAAKAGLSTYHNQGDGTFKKIAGKEGPDILRR